MNKHMEMGREVLDVVSVSLPRGACRMDGPSVLLGSGDSWMLLWVKGGLTLHLLTPGKPTATTRWEGTNCPCKYVVREIRKHMDLPAFTE